MTVPWQSRQVKLWSKHAHLGFALVENEVQAPRIGCPPPTPPLCLCQHSDTVQQTSYLETTSSAGWWSHVIHPWHAFLTHWFKATNAVYSCATRLFIFSREAIWATWEAEAECRLGPPLLGTELPSAWLTLLLTLVFSLASSSYMDSSHPSEPRSCPPNTCNSLMNQSIIF